MKTRNKSRQLPKLNLSRGAPMGMCDIVPDNCNLPIKLYLRRMSWVDGDYLQNGAYYGGGNGDSIYWSYSADGTSDIFIRAKSRKDAREQVIAKFPNAKFYN